MSNKVKKGCVAVRVGSEDEEGGFKRFVIPISHLYHPLFKKLLERAQEVYGYHTTGVLKLPCSVDDFVHLRWQMERESKHQQYHHHQHSHHHQQHKQLSSSLSFRSC